MSLTALACLLVSVAWMALFWLWGSSFLTGIRAKRSFAGSVVFGYLVCQSFYQLFYLPFLVFGGSYRVLSCLWLAVIASLSVLQAVFLRKRRSRRKRRLNRNEVVGICAAGAVILGLALYIALRVPLYGVDTQYYLSLMNELYYRDTSSVWYGVQRFHHGICSMNSLFTVSSLLTGIRPYYIFLFTMRLLGVYMTSMVLYRAGEIVFHRSGGRICWPALTLSVLVPLLLMCWGSQYTAEFYYWRINEAKGYCQFILLPLGFTVFLDMLKNPSRRKKLWKEQLLVGVAAVAVSASALVSYLFLLMMGTAALLARDRFRNGLKTLGRSAVCALPNLVYLAIYILEKTGKISL